MRPKDLRPFSLGVDDNLVRIYDRTGFPRIEVFMNTENDNETPEGIQRFAEIIVRRLNHAPRKARAK